MRLKRRKSRYNWSAIGGRKARSTRSFYARPRFGARGVITVAVAAVLLCGLAAGAYFLFFRNDETGLSADASGGATPTLAVLTTPEPHVTPAPTPPPGFNEQYAIDVSQNAVRLELPSPENVPNINSPCLYGDELLFSAGKGSISEPVLKTLYLYNVQTGTMDTVTQTRVTNGELFETLLNDRWLIWLDTDHQGTHRIYYLDRQAPPDEDGKPDIRQIKECKNAVPKLRLYGDTLIWTEQTEEKEDRVYEVNLTTGEDLSVALLSDAATYGVSAPSIYEKQVMWSGPDPSQTDEERQDGERSAIYVAHLDKPVGAPDEDTSDYTEEQLAALLAHLEGMDPFETEHTPMGMYVHEPMQNADAWVWLDANKAPDSTLYLRYNGEVVPVAIGVTAYQLSDNFVVYGHSQAVFAYYYKTQTYLRLSPEDEKAILPVVSGNRVVWFGPSDSSRDTLMTVVLGER